MSVWYCIPSKRPPEEAERCLQAWREQGYAVAVQRDKGEGLDLRAPSLVIEREYRGYSEATNFMVAQVAKRHPECEWFVCGGDDVFPDASHTADQIARQCSDHFLNLNIERTGETFNVHPTFGVMQPTGDRYGEDARSIQTYGADRAAYVDRVCGSPWIGREFALRINQGKGPLWPEYTHMFEDEELQSVAEKYSVLWQRRDLIHYHDHWARARANDEDRPAFLKEASGPEHWKKYGAIFRARKAAGFPGSEPL